MDRLTENHNETSPPIPEGLNDIFPILKSDCLKTCENVYFDAVNKLWTTISDDSKMKNIEKIPDSQLDEVDFENQPSRNNEW